MSIQPLMKAEQQPVCRCEGPRTLQGAQQKSFEKILNEKNNYKESLNNIRIEARELITRAQMQLLKGLVSETETSDDQAFSLISELGPFSTSKVSPSQMVDKYVATEKMSLSNAPGTERSDIETMIENIAAKLSLSSKLIRAVVTAESNFRPDAVSPVGAQGLMQLMPDTARELGVEDSFNPQQNLSGGSRYLKQLLEKYSGDLDHALAAYNWGQGNVDRYGLHRMPNETRNYIARIRREIDKSSV